MFRFMGLFCIIPATLLLTLGFFVLVTLAKVSSKALRNFAMAIIVLLCISALLVLSCGVYTLSTGTCPIMKSMKSMKCMKDMKHKRSMTQEEKMTHHDKQ